MKKLEDETRAHIQSKVSALLKMRSTAETSDKDPQENSFDFETPVKYKQHYLLTAECEDDTLADINLIQSSANKVRMAPVKSKVSLGTQIA